jgi:4-deoxy-L-threo-5-hexosulose-uronate ketol-isomerase
MHHLHDVHPDDLSHLNTALLRDRFLFQSLFVPGEQRLCYWDVDRTVFGGVTPVDTPMTLSTPANLAAACFCERRELGIINLGGPGWVKVGEEKFEMAPRDGLYVGRGGATPEFSSIDPSIPAKYYLLSYPAHAVYPTRHVKFTHLVGTHLGSSITANERTIYKYFAPGVVASCQLVMGLTLISPGSVWNTMPPHTHLRRSEVYCYCELASESIVMHFMGPPDATRHLVVRTGEAVVSPSWSIHAGAGTGAYAFVWGMGGENQTFDDMNRVALSELR